MKKLFLAVIPTLVFAACGTAQASTAADQVKNTERQVLTILTTSKHPEDACKYYTVASHDDCLTGILMTKSMGIKLSSLYPSGWQKRLDKAKVTIRGKRATVSPIMGTHETTKFSRVNGRWLIDSYAEKDAHAAS